MNSRLLELMMKMEIKKSLKNKVPYAKAVDMAAEKVKKMAKEAEFSAYCGNHDC